jgi:hypothetical protein
MYRATNAYACGFLVSRGYAASLSDADYQLDVIAKSVASGRLRVVWRWVRRKGIPDA